MTKVLQGPGGANASVQALLAELRRCSTTLDLERGKRVHAEAAKCGDDANIYVASALINMYAKCGSIRQAHEVFDGIKHPDVVSWNALILGYAANGLGNVSMVLFRRMRRARMPPNSLTFVAVLKACISLGSTGECMNQGREIHNLAVEDGCDCESKVHASLIDMYAKCSCMVEAHQVFCSMNHPDVVAWNVLIMGYADNGQSLAALGLFSKMRSEGFLPNAGTLVATLKACTSLTVAEERNKLLACRDMGKSIHNLVVDGGSDQDVFLQSTLINMYAKCGSMADARHVFNSVKHPDVVSWTAIIVGYADAGQGLTALNLFTRMRGDGPAPNSVTLMAALKACGLVGGLEFGKTLHAELCRDSTLDVVLVTCLVDFYAKCGGLEDAQRVFELHNETRNLVTWTALLSGFSNCGDHEAVFRLFDAMQDAGINPSSVTFLCVLACCKHAGLAEKGKECFDAMPSKYGVLPTIEHNSCMVDILGRSNKLDDAMALLRSMHCSPNDVTWKIVLCACRQWKNLGVGRLALQSLIEFNHGDTAAYLLMGQIYGSRGMLQEQVIVMEMGEALGTCGEACWTNELGGVHNFLD